MNNVDVISKLWGTKIAEIEKTSTKNHTNAILRKIALLKVNGISIGDILCEMGIYKVKVYGVGKVGREVIDGLKDKVEICGIYDANAEKLELGEELNSKLFTPEYLEIDDIPIIITPSAIFQKLSFEFIQKGMERFKILAVNTILTLGVEKLKGNDYISKYKKGVKQFLMTGAIFSNKGSQAMLFTAISEIKKRFSDAIIWYMPEDDFRKYTPEFQEKYGFLFVLDQMDLRSQIFEIVPGLTAIVDISGYALASFWDNERYMQTLRIARNYDIPLYLMPQSYGPFDFHEEKANELKMLLPYVKTIYAREKSTFDFLQNDYKLHNVKLSKDLVLQNKLIHLEHVYNEMRACDKLPEVLEHSIGIVPNLQCYNFGSIEETLLLNKKIIDHLLSLHREIYIVAHSDDQDVCRDIYTMYRNNPKVHLCVEELDCIEFGQYIKRFDYLIASRFHAIVHAYKENIPCIAIGWADKYNELLKSFQQERYAFDIRNDIDEDILLEAINYMNENYQQEKEVIKEILPSMQQENCFDILSELKEE